MCDCNFWVQAPREHLIIEFMLIKLMSEKFSAMRLIFFLRSTYRYIKVPGGTKHVKKTALVSKLNLLYMGMKLLDLKNLH